MAGLPVPAVADEEHGVDVNVDPESTLFTLQLLHGDREATDELFHTVCYRL